MLFKPDNKKSTNCRLIFGSSFRDLNYGPWPDVVCIRTWRRLWNKLFCFPFSIQVI